MPWPFKPNWQLVNAGKYALLLHAMAKKATGPQERCLKEAEELVKFQLRHGNDLLTMDSIRDCDVNLKEQGKLLLQVRPVFTQRAIQHR